MGLSRVSSNTVQSVLNRQDNGLLSKQGNPSRQAYDSVSFGTQAPVDLETLPQKSFWKTVNRSAWGGKRAGFWRKLGGLFIYPFALVKNLFLWMIGKTQGFKTLHPLRNESQDQIMGRIEKLNAEIKTPELRFNFSRQDIAEANLHKNHLLKAYDSLLGLKQLQLAKDWDSTASALERFLSANGKNNSESCANISATHALKLANGAPMKRVKLKKAEVSAAAIQRADGAVDTVILPPPRLRSNFDDELASASPEARRNSIQAAEKNLIERFGLKTAPRLLEQPMDVEVKLLKAGNGAQALLFDLIGHKGHVSLAVNIKGNIYHIDNLNEKSAQVSRFGNWLESKQIEKLWYAPLIESVHPGITGQ